MYDIFERDTLDTGLLQQISKVLKQNFFRHYTHDLLSTIKEEKSSYLTQVELLTALSEEIRYLRRQLSDLEKKYETLAKTRKGDNKGYKRRPKK